MHDEQEEGFDKIMAEECRAQGILRKNERGYFISFPLMKHLIFYVTKFPSLPPRPADLSVEFNIGQLLRYGFPHFIMGNILRTAYKLNQCIGGVIDQKYPAPKEVTYQFFMYHLFLQWCSSNYEIAFEKVVEKLENEKKKQINRFFH